MPRCSVCLGSWKQHPVSLTPRPEPWCPQTPENVYRMEPDWDALAYPTSKRACLSHLSDVTALEETIPLPDSLASEHLGINRVNNNENPPFIKGPPSDALELSGMFFLFISYLGCPEEGQESKFRTTDWTSGSHLSSGSSVPQSSHLYLFTNSWATATGLTAWSSLWQQRSLLI